MWRSQFQGFLELAWIEFPLCLRKVRTFLKTIWSLVVSDTLAQMYWLESNFSGFPLCSKLIKPMVLWYLFWLNRFILYSELTILLKYGSKVNMLSLDFRHSIPHKRLKLYPTMMCIVDGKFVRHACQTIRENCQLKFYTCWARFLNI